MLLLSTCAGCGCVSICWTGEAICCSVASKTGTEFATGPHRISPGILGGVGYEFCAGRMRLLLGATLFQKLLEGKVIFPSNGKALVHSCDAGQDLDAHSV